jgi:hypothetical protein
MVLHGVFVSVCVVYLSDGIDGSSAVDRELFVASVKQIHSECFTQTVLILTSNGDDDDDDNDDGTEQEYGEEVLIDCQVIQSMLKMHVCMHIVYG